MGRLLSLNQVEKGAELREALRRLNKITDKLIVTDVQSDFKLSMQPDKNDVVMKINGIEYLENESFVVNRENRNLKWDGAFSISPELNVQDNYTFDHWGGVTGYPNGSTALAMNTEEIQIYYTSEEVYDGLVEPECRGKYKGDETLYYAPGLKTERVRDMTDMFSGCSKLTSVPTYDTRNVQKMRSMFNGCNQLRGIPLLDTTNVLDMSRMFQNCTVLDNIPEFDTSSVIDMLCMFEGCSSLTTVSGLNTVNVRNMYNMFNGCSKLTTVSGLNTVNVRGMSYMFNGCSKLVTIDQLNLNSIDQYAMPSFYGCSELQNIGFEPKTIHYSISFSNSSKLTKVSLLSILNGLGTPKNIQDKTLTLHADSKALLTASELKIATDKGWVVA